MKSFIIYKNDANQRIDKYISKLMPNLPKSLLYKGLRKNNVRLNGKHCHDGSVVLKESDEIALYFPDEYFEKSDRKISELPYPEVIYEDENILIADKPTNLPSHADDKGSTDTLIDRILFYLYEKGEYNPECENTFSPALCNRLDRNTSGLVIAAKNAETLRILNAKIKTREIQKYYICRCVGIPKKDEQILESYLERETKKVKINNKKNGKLIRTGYKVIKKEGATSLLEINLLTGRTHQIRAHLASIGNPLAGDFKYGGGKSKYGYFLKSYKLVFDFNTDAGILNYLKGKIVAIERGCLKMHRPFNGSK